MLRGVAIYDGCGDFDFIKVSKGFLFCAIIQAA